MAKLNSTYKSSRKAEIDVSRKQKKLGLPRTVFSALSLLFGAAMFYVALHYIPAFVNPKQILKFASDGTSATNTYNFENKSSLQKVLGPYADLFHMDRAYMKSGQSINFKYDLPEGAHVKVEIVQCRRAWVIEIFKCGVVGQYSSQTKRQRGIESFVLKDSGFYHFREQTFGLKDDASYSTVWRRKL